eukprot:TRINITY_DN166_c0_g1::TRINITY_DN166_c0_g1_i1::g.14219::m.14219 TRINITY_DN166_c0_g1::TRINITY_DN166_c0_g1_i1::g.14219  ORF type:complete len:402 (+),score=30.94,PH/PF00169.24/5.1e+02,PH/PF00169.24/0.0028,PH/PF00169.24/2.6,PH_3/PF14593.1/3.1e+03,PH_3/PF14593.1/7.7e-05,PH_11/PF15413.1/1.1e+04,PH_11/PF15413.1/0.012,PH_11/PF15413.1/1.5e+02,PH_8/PF15409.1/0.37,PH_8/PF15409.1/7.9e+03,PH_8/PF15409.1/4e+03 TRINITY_DN166_c0_g1_i1:53-1207(+)
MDHDHAARDTYAAMIIRCVTFIEDLPVEIKICWGLASIAPFFSWTVFLVFFLSSSYLSYLKATELQTTTSETKQTTSGPSSPSNIVRSLSPVRSSDPHARGNTSPKGSSTPLNQTSNSLVAQDPQNQHPDDDFRSPKSGWVHRKGLHGLWAKKWLVLDYEAGTLKYYTNPPLDTVAGDKARRCIDLCECSLTETSRISHKHGLDICAAPGRRLNADMETISFAFDTEHDMLDWKFAIAEVVAMVSCSSQSVSSSDPASDNSWQHLLYPEERVTRISRVAPRGTWISARQHYIILTSKPRILEGSDGTKRRVREILWDKTLPRTELGDSSDSLFQINTKNDQYKYKVVDGSGAKGWVDAIMYAQTDKLSAELFQKNRRKTIHTDS